MKQIISISAIIVLLTGIVLGAIYFKSIKMEPKELIPKSTLGREGKDSGEFSAPTSLGIKEGRLYVADLYNSRIQTLKISPDGNLSPMFSFGKEGKGLGEFDRPITLAIRGNWLYVAELGNHRIQVLEIKY